MTRLPAHVARRSLPAPAPVSPEERALLRAWDDYRLSWAAYVRLRAERLPRGYVPEAFTGDPWAGVTVSEERRVTRNWRRWQASREGPA